MAKRSGRGRGAGPVGSRVRYGPTGRAQVVKTGGYQWSDEAEEAFFDHLAETCNVRASAAAVGFTTFTVYRQRRMRPEFKERWRLVLDEAYDRLEMGLVQAAIESIEGVEPRVDPEPESAAQKQAERPFPKMTVEQAMNVLRAHRNQVRGDGRRGPGRIGRRPALDEVRASIEKKARAIIAARALKAGHPAQEASPRTGEAQG